MKVDGVRPSILSIDLPADKTYQAGEVLEFSVLFSEPMDVTTPIGIDTYGFTDNADRQVAFHRVDSDRVYFATRY